jgi:hypothetical protein
MYLLPLALLALLSCREHRKLAQLVDAWPSGTNIRWSEIATQLPGRSGKQCRERFLNHVK